MEKLHIILIFGLIVEFIISAYYINKFKKEVDQHKDEYLQIRGEYYHYQRNNKKAGGELLTQPFIPDYLGFLVTVVRDKKTSVFKAEIYTKQGFNIGREINTDFPQWILLTPGGEKHELVIKNMYDGIILLNHLGVDVTLNEYLLGKY